MKILNTIYWRLCLLPKVKNPCRLSQSCDSPEKVHHIFDIVKSARFVPQRQDFLNFEATKQNRCGNRNTPI